MSENVSGTPYPGRHPGGAAPLVEGRLREAALLADLLDRHTQFGRLEKADDLLFGESACLHVRHSRSLTGFSLLLNGMA